MEQPADGSSTGAGAHASSRPAPSRKRSISGAAGGLLSRIPFVRSSRSGDNLRPRSRHSSEDGESSTSASSPSPFPPVPELLSAPVENAWPRRTSSMVPVSSASYVRQQQQDQQEEQQQQIKTRRRRGSLRKVALLGRGAQRERKEAKATLTLDTNLDTDLQTAPPTAPVSSVTTTQNEHDSDPHGYAISDITPRPSMDGYANRSNTLSNANTETTSISTRSPNLIPSPPGIQKTDTTDSTVTSPIISYSTTDDEDALHIRGPVLRPTTASSSAASMLRPERASISSGSEGYFAGSIPNTQLRPTGTGAVRGAPSPQPSIQRRRSATQRAKSPLALTSLSGLTTTPLPPADTDWDYAETEWWGWVVLVVTWVVFVTGMGSTLGVWSWAWDVGSTPYAPPELEDDPTLPIVGYYPALILLTCVMAWVWVVAAWMGMKYFRHARVSG